MTKNAIDLLTKREAEVARCAANGLTNEEIAAVFILDADTVKVHLRASFKKLGIQRRQHLLDFFPSNRRYKVSYTPTIKEAEILDEIVNGLTDADIAHAREVSQSSINQDITRIRAQTGLMTRNELALWWSIKTKRGKLSKDPLPPEFAAVLDQRGKDRTSDKTTPRNDDGRYIRSTRRKLLRGIAVARDQFSELETNEWFQVLDDVVIFRPMVNQRTPLPIEGETPQFVRPEAFPKYLERFDKDIKAGKYDRVIMSLRDESVSA